MNVRQILKRSETMVGLIRDARSLTRNVETLRTTNWFLQQKIKRNYLASSHVKKLQIGSGPNTLEGWLSTDIAPASEGVIYLDATKRFPFAENTFDYVYSEHMIEHIPRNDGLFMLKECRRVLKPGGILRLSTPDLEVLLSLYFHGEDPLSERYIKWITDRYLGKMNVYKASYVINNAFRNWEHQFLYDGELMEIAMQEAGFTNMRRYAPGESDDENLRGIESHGKKVGDNEMADFETMIFEGSRPV